VANADPLGGGGLTTVKRGKQRKKVGAPIEKWYLEVGAKLIEERVGKEIKG